MIIMPLQQEFEQACEPIDHDQERTWVLGLLKSYMTFRAQKRRKLRLHGKILGAHIDLLVVDDPRQREDFDK